MKDFIMTFILGAVICVIGAINMTGNISTLHRYHRKRVSEEDRIPFGRTVGLGTIICGVALTLFSITSAITFYTHSQAVSIVGTVFLIAGLVAGLGLNFYALFKYNKGIF